jgi:2,4-dienoyl-CoA reductase-like NADH-dependent reductase (Old Yellow Enzyme family)
MQRIQLTLNIMNRSVQYELDCDSMQGGSELIGSLRENGDMGAQRTLVEKEYWRRRYSGTFTLNAGIDREHVNQLLKDDPRNLVAFGRPFIANRADTPQGSAERAAA